MKIIDILISSLKPYELNAKQHPESQIKGLMNSIKVFDITQPAVVNKENEIIIGHGRVEAAKRLGIEKYPCFVRDDLTEEEIKALRLVDNRISETGWDIDKLKIDITNLDYDLKKFNVSFDDLLTSSIIPSEGEIEDDQLPENVEKKEIKVVNGDLFELGNHRLMCGDSTNPEHVKKLCGNNKPILMVTDPPYGVEYNPEWRSDSGKAIGDTTKGKVLNDDKIDWTDAYSLFEGDVVYVWHAGKYTHEVAQHLINCDFKIISQIIWAKQHFAISRGDYHWQHEPCIYAVRSGSNHNWQGARDQSTLWDIKSNNAFGNSEREKTWGHGTQKPLECMLRPIQNNSAFNEYIYDPFGGSGTTLIACEKVERRCLMMELSEEYCQTIIQRFIEFSNKPVYLLKEDGSKVEWSKL